MAQVGRAGKNLETPRPLKTSMRVSHHAPATELQSSNIHKSLSKYCYLSSANPLKYAFKFTVEELITLIENVADSVSIGQCNPDEMALLLSNLRIHGLQLEDYSKSTLDQGNEYNTFGGKIIQKNKNYTVTRAIFIALRKYLCSHLYHIFNQTCMLTVVFIARMPFVHYRLTGTYLRLCTRERIYG